MTQEVQQSKDFFRLNGGLNTEINELTFPDGFTTDEANYELMPDGSRRRRKGLGAESGQGAAQTVGTWTSSEFSQSYLWRDAGGDPDKNIMVFRQGDTLYFADADETVSGGWYSQPVAIEVFETSGATTANTDDKPLTFSQGRGFLFVSGPYYESFYVEFDGTSTFTANPITLRIRDFSDIEDGENTAKEPTGTITADHRYNLRNRGWKQDDMDTYFSDKSKHPAKNSVWWRGYKRTYGASIYEKDGQRSWDSNKLEAEAFGSSSAPRGSLFLEPYDTTFGYGISAAGSGVHAVTTWSFVDGGATWTVTITTATAHGLGVGDDFLWEGHNSSFNAEYAPGEPDLKFFSWSGKHTTIAGTTGSTVVITVDEPTGYQFFTSWANQYLALGDVDATLSLDRSIGTTHTDGMSAIEFHAGRVFMGGMRNSEFADTIFFSQIADSEEKFGRCFQEADPTDEHFNSLTPADGGTIIIPGMSGVQNLVSVRDSLIVVAREGVWEISGGRRGVFTANGYSVRKLSDQGGNAPLGTQSIESALVYTGPGGIFIVQPNEFTGLLEVSSASETTIQTLWNQIPDAEQIRMQCAYDPALRRMYFMYGPDGTGVGIDTFLIFDARALAWFKYTFDTPSDNELVAGFSIPNADDSSTTNKMMKFIYKATSSTVNIADFDQTDFDDWDGTNGPLPYLVFGHDMMGDAQRRGQAPIITVYSKRTETGYTDTGAGWDPVNDSSTLMSAYWDWTDDAVTNKIGAQQQVYRHVRHFVPADANDVDGYPIVVTRNKVRGRGRALQLRFDGATDKDSHVIGFTTNYKITRKK